MPQNKKIIIANWKMNPQTLVEAKRLAQAYKEDLKKNKKVELVVCPPAVFLSLLANEFKKSKLSFGIQDVFWEERGAYTGRVAAAMAYSVGAGKVLVGHSEMRTFTDDNQTVNKKLKAVLKVGLQPVLCIGETERDEAGQYLKVLEEQLKQGLSGVKKVDVAKIMVAYEPVWAIGAKAKSGDSPEGFLQNALFIRKVLAGIVSQEKAMTIPVLYGGSVNAGNAGGFLTAGRADGLLVGRVSLMSSQFRQVMNSF
jgi:triosephosphate isomerase (TIM)